VKEDEDILQRSPEKKKHHGPTTQTSLSGFENEWKQEEAS